jgi:hypothetical protein
MRAGQGIRLILGAALFTACAVLSTQTPNVGAQGPAIQVPIRWCALEGTDAAADPSVLESRLQSASQVFQSNNADIEFVNALTSAGVSDVDIPTIPDPSSAAGMPGDIVFPEPDNYKERNDAEAACEAEWKQIGADNGVTLHGPIAINIQQFVRTDNSIVDIDGISKAPIITRSDGTNTRCTDATDISSVSNGTITIVDSSTIGDSNLDAIKTAHELGHMLNLGHGNGIDDDGDVLYDQFCDLCDESISPSANLMNSVPSNSTTVLTPEQIRDARAVAEKIV